MDKQSLASFKAAPSRIVVKFTHAFADLDHGDIVSLDGLRTSVVAIVNGDTFLSLNNGTVMYCKDGFGSASARNNSYVHVKSGKRFIAYKVVDSSSVSHSLTLRRVKAPAVRGTTARTRSASRRSR